MAKISKKGRLKRVKKRLWRKLRRFILRHPWVVAVITYALGVILESAAEYYLADVWARLGSLVRGLFT